MATDVRYRYVSLEVEGSTTFGTPAVATPWYANPAAGSMDLDNSVLLKAGIGSRAPTAQKLGPAVFSGSLSTMLDPQFAGWILSGFFGHAVISAGYGGASDVYEHEFIPDDVLPSFTMSIARDAGGTDDYRLAQYSGTMITGFSIEAVVGDFVTLSADWVARNEIVLEDSSAIPKPFDDQPDVFVYHEADFNIWGSTDWAGHDVAAFRITGANNLKTDHQYLGSRLLGGPNAVKPPVAARNITGSIDIPHETAASQEWYQRAFGGGSTDVSVQNEFTALHALLTVTGTKTFGASTDANYAGWIYMPAIVINSRAAGISARDPTMLTLPFTAVEALIEGTTYLAVDSDPLFNPAVFTDEPTYGEILMGLVNASTGDFLTAHAPP